MARTFFRCKHASHGLAVVRKPRDRFAWEKSMEIAIGLEACLPDAVLCEAFCTDSQVVHHTP
jgi:hypothetical protein